MCWATYPNQSRYLTFQMSKNVVSSLLVYTTKIGVAIITSKGNAFVKEPPFLQCFLNFIAIVKDVSSLRLLTSSNLDCMPPFFQSKYCMTIGKSFVDL